MPRTGRPRGFDKDKAVQQATGLFWKQGHEATSPARLKAAMGGMWGASLYAAFGSEEALFRLVLDHCLQTRGQVIAPLLDDARSLRGLLPTGQPDPALLDVKAEADHGDEWYAGDQQALEHLKHRSSPFPSPVERYTP